MASRPPVFSLKKGPFRTADLGRRFGGERRRVAPAAAPAIAAPTVPVSWSDSGVGSGPALQILRSILRSAAELVGAEQCFFLVTPNESVLEVACAHHIRPAQVIEIVLGRGAQAVRRSLCDRTVAWADAQGRLMPALDGYFESNSPAILCLPLDLGLSHAGVLCMLRRRSGRRVSELDLEILHALTEQAALTIGAASHQSALTRLEASLSALAPNPA